MNENHVGKNQNSSSLEGYLELIRSHPLSLSFGLLHSLFSNLGQTHFISLFSPLIMAQWGLSHSQYGLIYSSLTLTSALGLHFVAPLIDQKDVRFIGLFIGLGLILSLWLFIHPQLFFFSIFGLFGLRFLGQGLCGVLQSTVIARYFGDQKGKALSLSSLGFPLAEGLVTPLLTYSLPLLGLSFIGHILIAILIFIFIPLNLFLTAGLPSFNRVQSPTQPTLPPTYPPVKQEHSGPKKNKTSKKSWTRTQVFSDKMIYFLLPQILICPFALTGVFFHQVAIGHMKGWSPFLMGSSFIFFALGRIFTGFITGLFVDSFGAQKIFTICQIPLCLGCFLLAVGNSPYIPGISFSLFGLSVGSLTVARASTFVEVYGVEHLGAIKGTLSTLMILSTALSPALLGWLLYSIRQLNLFLILMSVLGLIAAFLTSVTLKTNESKKT